MDFSIWNVSYINAAGIKQRSTLTAMDATDARTSFNNQARIDGNKFFDCKLIRVWKNAPSSPKQKLAQTYGYLMRSIKGAKVTLHKCEFERCDSESKLGRAQLLVNSQFAKLERDIRDLFKIAGLKVK